MNSVTLMGRLVRDPEVTYSKELAITKFCVAVDRPMRKKAEGGSKETDFINCTCFGKSAEVVGNYFHKGSRILVEGRLQVSSYTDKNGNKRTSTDVIVNNFYFVDSKKNNTASPVLSDEGFANMGGAVPFQGDIPF